MIVSPLPSSKIVNCGGFCSREQDTAVALGWQGWMKYKSLPFEVSSTNGSILHLDYVIELAQSEMYPVDRGDYFAAPNANSAGLNRCSLFHSKNSRAAPVCLK